MNPVTADYLVVGAGIAGLAFTDSLLASTEARIVLVDRRASPGGHWNDSYSFVQLHQPSAFYGINSLPLGADTVDAAGYNAGLFERATGREISDYCIRALDEVLLPTGQVRFFGGWEYASSAGEVHSLVSRTTGEACSVVAPKLVDATYEEPAIPATHSPSFGLADGVALVPVGQLTEVADGFKTFTLLGAGKTAMDAATWLLDHGVDPEMIRWVRPREAWLHNREHFQPLDQVGSIVEGLSLDLEALALADSQDDVFAHLEATGRMFRIDQGIRPSMWRCATITAAELAVQRQITDVVRLGRLRRIDQNETVLEQGSIANREDTVHVDCTAAGLRVSEPRPVFERDRITIQQVRTCQPALNAALTGFLEATRPDEVEKNRLMRPNPMPSRTRDWLTNMALSRPAEGAWSADSDIAAWLEGARLNLTRGRRHYGDDPRMQEAFERIRTHQEAALTTIARLLNGSQA